MKLSKYIILYCFLFCSLALPLFLKGRELAVYQAEKIRYLTAYDTAVDDALDVLLAVVDGEEYIDKEKAVESLVRSLAASLGLPGSGAEAERLQLYIPAVMAVEPDGCSFYYHDIVQGSGGKELVHLWSEKIPFVYEEDGTIFALQLDGVLSFVDSAGGYFRMEYPQFQEDFPGYRLADSGIYQRVLSQVVVRTYQENLSYYINQHNYIARQYGIQYQFYLPYLDERDSRLLDDVGLAVFFEGFPISTNKTFDRYTFAGADVIKPEGYYFGEVGGAACYHFGSCHYAIQEGRIAWSKKEAAMAGAYPCPYCRP